MGMKLDGPVATDAIDSSGETLSIQGLDITDFLEGKAVANWEHNNASDDGAVGKFIYAKKIFKESDCENPRQKLFWEQLKHPFLYGVVELFDEEGHPGSVAIAAMVRYYINRKEKIKVGMSIEGATLERNGNQLLRAVARKAAITLTPCNKECWVDLFGIEAPVSKTETVEIDSFESLQKSYHGQSEEELFNEIKADILELNKTLTAGSMNVAPSNLTGNAALTREHIVGRKDHLERVKQALKKWDKKRPLKEVVKAALPEVTDKYVDHFVDLANDLTLKKGGEMAATTRVSPSMQSFKFLSPHASSDQKALATGIYLPQSLSEGNFNGEIFHNDAGDKVCLQCWGQAAPNLVNADNYYFLMDRFFNLAKHFPKTVAFQINHPQGVSPSFLATEHIDGHIPDGKIFADRVFDMKANGEFYHLIVAELILGQSKKRLPFNTVLSGDTLILLDNTETFTDSISAVAGHEADLISQPAQQWLNTLNEKKLIYYMALLQIPRAKIVQAVNRLTIIKGNASSKTLGDIANLLGGPNAQNTGNQVQPL